MIEGTELLAPARDLTAGRAAIDAGADAVYIGAPRFGARSRAGNTLSDIAALAAYAHAYWARVYVTVNTLLYDEELPAAVKLIEDLYGIGADAIIIQDVGLLEVDLPPIPLIASTQMHNATPERVKFLEDVGFGRAILARELSLDEIRAIREATDTIELEVFVHGALCVSYSGQCYMSYAAGGRSGNRGECAQPCRRRYDLVDSRGHRLEEGQYLLSLRDMKRIDDLGELLDAGVTSFKIEGRLKDEVYVKNVVAAYRAQLNGELEVRGMRRSSSGRSDIDFTPDLNKTFNRRYTTYFLHGREDAPGSPDTPKMMGETLGEVVAVGPQTFTVDTDAEIHNGDGITYFDADRRLQGTVVNGARRSDAGVVVTPNEMADVRTGTVIYRNHDHAFLKRAEKAAPERTIGMQFALSATGSGYTITVMDEDWNAATAALDYAHIPARKPEQALQQAREQLAKTGDTIFRCEDVTVDWPEAYFLPFSALNELRRRALDALTATRAVNRPAITKTTAKNEVPYPEAELTYRGNALNAQAVAFFRRHGVEEIEPAAESGLEMKGRTVMTTRYCIKAELGLCPREGAVEAVEEPLYLVDEVGHQYELQFNCDAGPDACGMRVIY